VGDFVEVLAEVGVESLVGITFSVSFGNISSVDGGISPRGTPCISPSMTISELIVILIKFHTSQNRNY
jgi:hypothetical protein